MSDWQPIENAPYGEVLEVKNDLMDKPVLATRGYASNGVVNKNNKLFTSVYTPDELFPVPAGNLVCPTEWRTP